MKYHVVKEPASPAEMASMTKDKQMLLLAQRRANAAHTDLVDNLCRIGHLDEALSLSHDDPDKSKFVETLMVARDEDDDKQCDCVVTVDEADYTRNPNAKPQLKRVNNYVKKFSFLSGKHGEVVNLHECTNCGHTNAVPGVLGPDEVIKGEG
jgi:hypothetical protein